MNNYLPSNLPSPSDNELEALARKLPPAIKRDYKLHPEWVESQSRFYNATYLFDLLIGHGLSEDEAVRVIRWLCKRGLLVALRDAVRDPDRFELPHLPEPWLSAVLNGRLLDELSEHSPFDQTFEEYLKRLDEGLANESFESYLKRLENAESEAYLTTPDLWDWWRSAEPAEPAKPTGEKKEHAASPEPTIANRLQVNVETQEIWLDGERYEVESETACRFVAVLLKNNEGKWITDWEEHDEELKKGTEYRKFKKYLPDEVRKLIKSRRGAYGGTRLSPR